MVKRLLALGDEQVLIELIDRNMQAESSVSLLDSWQKELFRNCPTYTGEPVSINLPQVADTRVCKIDIR